MDEEEGEGNYARSRSILGSSLVPNKRHQLELARRPIHQLLLFHRNNLEHRFYNRPKGFFRICRQYVDGMR